jgi:O-acetylserine/cysteine efflux transporter
MLTAAIIYSVIVMFAFGIANAVSKEMVGKFGVLGAIIFQNAFVVPFIALAILILRAPISLDPLYLGIGAVIAFGGYLGFICFMSALKNGKIGVIIPIVSAQIIVASIFGFLFLGDQLDIFKIATVSIVFVGIVLASVNFRDFRNSDLFSLKSGVPYALLAALIWGFALPLYKIPSEHLGAHFYGLVIEFVVFASALLQTLITRGPRSLGELAKRPTPRLALIIFAATVSTTLGTVFTNLAFQTGQISIVSAIRGASSIVSLVIGAILYREVLSKQQYIGAIIVTMGILLPVLSFVKP